MLLPPRMGRRLLIVAGAVALAGCGGGPHLVSHPVEARTFAARPGATCGQELVTTTFVARGARWGEDLDVVVCGAHALSGRIEVTADRVNMGGPFTWTGGFGDQRDNRRCLDGAVVAASGAGAVSPAAPRSTGASAGAASAAPGATATSAFEEVSWGAAGDDVCAEAMDTVMELDWLRPGSAIRVRLWSATPNDLARAVVRIRHEVERPNVSDAAWQKHLEADARRREADERSQRAREARSARALDPGFAGRLQDRWNRTDADAGAGAGSSTPTSAPPPPRPEVRPQRPTAAAEWIPGFWRWAGRDWVWIAGRWRAPDPSAPPRPVPPAARRPPPDGTGTGVTIEIP